MSTDTTDTTDTTNNKNSERREVILFKEATLFYSSLFTPSSNPQYPNDPPRYSATILLNKVTHAAEIKKVLDLRSRYKILVGGITDTRMIPIIDGDDEEYSKKNPAAMGHIVIKTKLRADEREPINC